MSLLPVLVIALVCVAVGVVAGVVVVNLAGSKTPAVQSTDPGLDHAAGLWREKSTGRLLVEMDGLKFHSFSEMDNDQRLRLNKTVDELRYWTGFREQPRAGEAAPKPPVERPETGQPVSRPPGQPAASIKRPSLNPVDVFTRALQADVPSLGDPPMSIASQIDEILQTKLEVSPLKGRAIRLMELPGKGMVVMVGLDQYDSVSAVPDPEIRSLLQACVEEWEGRHT
jgi:hypothetical protein